MKDDVVIHMSASEVERLRRACDAYDLFDAASRVFGFLGKGLSLGFITLDDEAAIIALAELAERALDHASREEGETLSRLSARLAAATAGREVAAC